MLKSSLLSKHKDYFEAVIQIRPHSIPVLDFIKKAVSKRDSVFISRVVSHKYGDDIYISSQRFARSLGKKLKDNFDGELKVTRTLHTRDRQRGRQIYRGTILFRLS